MTFSISTIGTPCHRTAKTPSLMTYVTIWKQRRDLASLDSARLAAGRADGRANGGACASDAFFPFRDGLDAAAESGVSCVIQPGGSVRDDEVIAAADEHGIAMVFTGQRHFRH